MPELPEVETTCRGIAPFVVGKNIRKVTVRRHDLRQAIPKDLPQLLEGRRCLGLERRAKYLLMRFAHGHVLGHLGMSGSLRLVHEKEPWRKHEHFALGLPHRQELRYHDPRRFGLWIWTEKAIHEHPLLAKLGPEPLSTHFEAESFFQSTRKRQRSLKEHLMDPKVVVGVGNIYAAESLFHAGLRPGRRASALTRAGSEKLVQEVKRVLAAAIAQGGTTLQDFSGADGNPGYFAQELWVYGRTGEECRRCGGTIRQKVLGQRSSFYCPSCQS